MAIILSISFLNPLKLIYIFFFISGTITYPPPNVNALSKKAEKTMSSMSVIFSLSCPLFSRSFYVYCSIRINVFFPSLTNLIYPHHLHLFFTAPYYYILLSYMAVVMLSFCIEDSSKSESLISKRIPTAH